MGADYLGRTFVGMPAKFVPDVLQNSSVIRIATLRDWPDHKKMQCYDLFLPTWTPFSEKANEGGGGGGVGARKE